MRRPTCWDDLTGVPVGLWGLGTEGMANHRRLAAMGVTPVVVDDAGPASDIPTLTMAGGGLEALSRCAVVIKSPGISRYRPEVSQLVASGVVVVGGLGLWLAGWHGDDTAPVVCVTGTKGKSTTAALMGHLATGLGRRVFVGGNIGAPPWDPEANPDADLWVVETSSYQAADSEVGAPVVGLTSLHPDHLPWHGDIDTYYRDKLSLCTKPGTRHVVAAATSNELRHHAQLLGDDVRWVDDTTFAEGWDAPLGLVGRHNRVNAAVARACLLAAGVTGAEDDAAMEAASAGFAGLACRMEPAGEVAGVRFIDDSLSTNVLPTLAALDALAGEQVALLAGGDDRGIDYRLLGEAVASRREPTRVFSMYTTGPAIAAAIAAASPAAGETVRETTSGDPDDASVEPCPDLVTAVRRAWEWARPNGVVLLSPAAASFDAFDDYRHRSRVFRAAIADLSPPPAPPTPLAPPPPSPLEQP